MPEPDIEQQLSEPKLRAYFITHLNRIYCAKKHLVEQLPYLAEAANFKDLKNAILETRDDVQKQIARMDEIFIILHAQQSDESCQGMLGLLEDVYKAIVNEANDPVMRDLSILFYIQNIESIETASFQVLRFAAIQMKEKKIIQLIRENADESKEDRALFLAIAAKYLLA